jgi:cytohesin
MSDLSKEQVLTLIKAAMTGDATAFKAAFGGLSSVQFQVTIGALRDVTLLHLAAYGGSGEIVQTLLSAGAEIDACDANGSTPLHTAANAGKSEVVKLLLDAGANPEARESQQGMRPIHFAALMGHDAVIAALLEANTDKNAVDGEGSSALMYAADGDHTVVVRRLLDAGVDTKLRLHGTTALDAAIARGHRETADLLRSRVSQSAP